MGNGHSSLPRQGNYEYGYTQAYQLACEQLAKIDNIQQQCIRSGAQYQEAGWQQIITLKYLNRTYRVTLPHIDVSLTDSEEEVPPRDKILILHYLIMAKGTPIADKPITFKELPEGINYFPPFSKRTIKPLVDHFGNEPHLLIDAAAILGGYKAGYGDVAATINAFPYVPITLVLWRGDEEFPPSGSIMFDATISDYLSAEDISVLCQTISWKLVKSLK
jgi:hypothetical protein